MLGRYSLDEEGLAFAGGEFDRFKYNRLEVDEDGILPILANTWFDDDIIEELKRFLKVAFGEMYLTENLKYIAKVLKPNSSDSAESVIRNYFLKDFYKDHLQIYKKRPIYWMFTSGKEKAFNCLMYLHRYDKTTLSRIRKDYLHEFQAKLDRAKAQAEDEGNVKLNSLYSKYQSELLEYDRKLQVLADAQIELDLDDGVKVNYGKLKGLLEAEKDIVGKDK
jgi:type II restriction/modification system DNA methylase subunit YeeA